MESQAQNPELRINPENFHPCIFAKGETPWPAAAELVYIRMVHYLL